MILKGGEAVRYFAKPDPAKAGLLIYGSDAMRVALRRQEVILALVGKEGEAEMRLTRMSGSDLRKDPARLIDAMKAQGFFPGPRVVFVEEATDGLAPQFDAALKEWRPGDAQIIVTAGELKGKTAPLKVVFEKNLNTYAVALYDEPPSREEIESALQKAGLTRIEPAAMADLTTLARALDPGDFRQFLEKVALYKHGDPTPLVPQDVAALAPSSIEAGVDDLIMVAADGNAGQIGLLVRRLEGQGTNPVTICIAALRHFRGLQAAMADPGGVQSGLARFRGNFKVKDAMTRQAGMWSRDGIDRAVAAILETDLTLRSASRAPGMAVMERTLIRLAMMARAR